METEYTMSQIRFLATLVYIDPMTFRNIILLRINPKTVLTPKDYICFLSLGNNISSSIVPTQAPIFVAMPTV